MTESPKEKGVSELGDVKLDPYYGVKLNPYFTNVFAEMLAKTLGERKAVAALLRMRPKLSLPEPQQDSEEYAKKVKPIQLALIFWDKLVKAVGKRQAESIMRTVMGTKREGRTGDLPLWGLIFHYIHDYGQNESDAKIAQRIIDSKPYQVRCESGEIGVVNNWITEERIFWDKTIVERKPINKGLEAIEKQVGRVRRWAIEEKLLTKEYAPKAHYRG